MSSPNIVTVTSIIGNTAYLIPSGTSATSWSALTPSTNTVNKVNNIVAANVTSAPATITLSVNSGVGGAGTNFRLANQITVPAYASLIIVDKTTAIYVTDAQSIVVTSGTSNAIELVSSYEAIS